MGEPDSSTTPDGLRGADPGPRHPTAVEEEVFAKRTSPGGKGSEADGPDGSRATLDASYEAVLSQLGQGLLVADREGRIVFVNEAARRIPGGAALDARHGPCRLLPENGRPHPSLRPPPAPPAPPEDPAGEARWRVRTPDGGHVLVVGTAQPIRDPSGEQVATVLTLREPDAQVPVGLPADPTGQRAAEAALRASERELRTVTDALPVLIAVIDADERYRFINATYERWFGLSREAVVGRHIRDLLGDEAYAVRRDRIQAALRGEPQHFEAFTPSRDGKRLETELRYIPQRAEDGSVEGFIVLVTDVTERNATAAELRRFNEALESRVAASTAERDRLWRLTTDLMVVARSDGTILTLNPAWTATLGWTADELLGAQLLDLAHPDDRTETARVVSRVGESPEALRFENRFRAKSGDFRWLSWTAVSEEGLMHGVARDVTAEKLQAEELSRAREALQQAQKMESIGQLTGGVAHDFNNLLGAVVGNLDLLGRKLNDERLRRYIDGAMAGAQRGAQLTRQLLAFARKQRLSPQSVDVNRLAEDTVTNLLRRTLGGLIQVEFLPAEDLWPAAVDPSQLESALLNLALNSRDAMSDGGALTIETCNVRIRDGAHVDLTPGDYVLVTVTDTGSGMPADVALRATEPFFTTKGIGKGTGLGLSTAYGFLRQSGGTLRITSHPGQGTSVQMYLPRSFEAAASAAPDGADVAAEGRGALVLLVDDDEGVRSTSAELLRELGYAVVEASTGRRALEILSAHPDIRLMVADYAMPGMNGAELLTAAREMRPGLKTIIVTGYAQGSDLDRLLPNAAVLRKPFNLVELAEGLRAAA